MTSSSLIFLGLAGVMAILNWIAVARSNTLLEYISKPSATSAFLLSAIFFDVAHSTSWWL